VATILTGKAVKLTKRTTVVSGADEIVDENALASLNAGLAVLPSYILGEPAVGAAMDTMYRNIEPGVEGMLNVLAQPDVTDRGTIVRNLVTMLTGQPLFYGNSAIQLVPISNLVVEARRGRDAATFDDLIVSITKARKDMGQATAMLGFRTTAMIYNRKIVAAAYRAFEHCMAAWIAPRNRNYWAMRMNKFKKRLGADELSKQIAKKEAEYLLASQLFDYYARLYMSSTDALGLIGKVLIEIPSAKVLQAATLIKLNQLLAVNGLYDMMPTIRTAMGDSVKFKKADGITPVTIEAGRHLVDAITLLEPLLRRDMKQIPIGKRAWTGSANQGYWTILFSLQYQRAFYFLGGEYMARGDKGESVADDFFTDGLDYALEGLETAAQAYLKNSKVDPRIRQVIKEQLFAAAKLDIDGETLEMVFPLGFTKHGTPWDAIWTTESPALAGRQMAIPLWELFPAITDPEYEALYENLRDSIELFASTRGLKGIAVEKPFKGLGPIIPLKQAVIRPIVISQITGERCIRPKDLDAMIGMPIIPVTWGPDMTYEYQATIPEHTPDWTIL
jgi:hypothetical protein